jgi:hypothetical protein
MDVDNPLQKHIIREPRIDGVEMNAIESRERLEELGNVEARLEDVENSGNDDSEGNVPETSSFLRRSGNRYAPLSQSIQGANDPFTRQMKKQSKYLYFVAFIVFFVIMDVLIIKMKPDEVEISTIMPSEVYIDDNYVNYTTFPFTVASTQQNTFKLLLLGDSLVDMPCKVHQLSEKLATRIIDDIYYFNGSSPTSSDSSDTHHHSTSKRKKRRKREGEIDFRVKVHCSGSKGSKIRDLKGKIQHDIVSKNKYHGIILFWDSDVASQSVAVLTDSITQQAYKEDVRYVLSTLQLATPWTAAAGPGILGEEQNSEKEEMLNLYQSFNQDIARELQIPYLNIRKGYQDMLPEYFHLKPAGFLTTEDGRHPNSAGTDLLIEYLLKQVLTWYSHRANSQP